MRASSYALCALWVSASLASCSADLPRPRPVSASSLIDETSRGAVRDQQAVWRYHPSEAAPLHARIAIDGGRAVFAGARGERWLLDGSKALAKAAARLAPENLVAIVGPSDGARTGYLFVGESGTGYEAREPLGAFVRSAAPPEPLAAVAARGSTLLGVRPAGGLVLSEDRGATYRAVGPVSLAQQGTAQAPERRFVDVAFDDAGNVFALAVPERFWRSRDLGRTWAELDTPAVGAYALGADESRHAVVRSVIGTHVLGAEGTLEPLGARALVQGYSLGVRLPRGPDAAALAEGRAALSAGRYYELERDAKRGFLLWSGAFGEPLVSRPMAALDGCDVVRVGAFDRWLYVACSRGGGLRTEQTFAFYASHDGGSTFAPEPYQAHGTLAAFALAVGADGGLLVTGICASGEKTACTRGVFYRRPVRTASRARATSKKQKRWELAPSATPSLKDTALALAFGERGARAYAVARRTKGGALALYVSGDGGKTFAARDLDEVQATAAPDESGDGPPPVDPQATEVVALTPASDGSVAIVLANPSVLVVTDDAGRVLSVAQPPEADVRVGAVGTRALAVAQSADDRRAWESLDGGVSWQSIGRVPLALCPEERCDAEVACGPAGCVLGNELSRVGWQGQGDEDAGVLAPPEPVAPRLYRHKLGVGLSCTLEEGAWRPLPSALAVPNAGNAAIGRVAWFVPAADRARAAAWVYHGFGGARPRVEREMLLAAPANPADWASHVAPQVEGAAALRYMVPERRPGETRLSEIEVAWDNLFENTARHAVLPAGAPFEIGDYTSLSGRQVANPALLSIASGGLYVQLHQLAGDKQPTLFFDGRTSTSIPAVPWPEQSVAGRTEMVHVGSQHVPIRILGKGAALVRARSSGSGWDMSAFTMGLIAPKRFGVEQATDITYVGGRAALVVHWRDPAGTRARAIAYPIRSDGAAVNAPVPLPTQLDVGESPRRCTAEQRSSTPRVVSVFEAGTRHLVQIVDSSEPLRTYLTDFAVLHGTPEGACVAAYDAEPGIMDGTPVTAEERAILPYDDLEHAWLFRQVASNEAAVEYRNMSCHIDPSLEAPPAVFRTPGTLAE